MESTSERNVGHFPKTHIPEFKFDASSVPGTGLPVNQDPFGDETNLEIKYKTMAWWLASRHEYAFLTLVSSFLTPVLSLTSFQVMIAETISLGILALPKALSVLGPFPGVAAILGIGLISTYTGYTVGQLKQRFMQIHSMADAGALLMGRHGSRALGLAQLLFFVFVMGSHILTFSIMMNVLTEHSNCTILYVSIGVLVSFVLTLPRRLKRLSHLSTISFVSICGAVLVIPTVHETCLAIANIVFAYAGHVAFFTFFSELRDIKDFPKALALLQTCEMILYTVSAIVFYAYVGQEVTSPVLSSVGRLFRMTSYGIAIPTIVIGGVVNAHVAVKFIYVSRFRGTNAMHTQYFQARATWAVICAGLWIVSWIIAEGIPVFNDVLGLAVCVFIARVPGLN
ncbi:Glycerol-3-phosphate dehydrogenase mitochondrial [Penicillium angulare]|uniref:Glycerol-3-phosphate dehydrogenase mitochondrial n=1 Tax=Penicillium angulare TaxID=116970 RepID=UPI00254230D8|nr:Glycerol-3-phosphate dehydrogenase mitochondrial [Penicillium angulare]KAJ5281943.1 Glycerol-3-phosphate dehydrogenase mitochondrial [Penicillium angulare]